MGVGACVSVHNIPNWFLTLTEYIRERFCGYDSSCLMSYMHHKLVMGYTKHANSVFTYE